ncbi:tetratricopeptide repeat protein [Methylophilus sp.]|jgi:tetratricopeptide (TPR) repeat protein|uniref:tetratricopeptide repeat protein n=1 Tax=Methylophilus sp. TaxID=29541 RepID=UPI0011D990D3|nr:tetratricopeptide repeat protein [Methylophilus sp.]TXI43734.1 MAG: tetratricopeptide repeat protein [Methylophilus sp.]
MNNEAIAKLLKLIADDPSRWDAYQKLAGLMLKNQEFHAAEQYLLQAISLQPKILELHVQLANLHMRTQQFKAAHECYKKAIALDVKQAQLYYLDARALKNMGRTQEAILRLRTATKFDPQQLQAFSECVDLMLQAQQLEPAANMLRQAVAAHPEHAHFHYRLGIVCQQLQAPDEALQCMQQAIQIQPDFAEAYHQHALILQLQGKTQAALASFNDAIIHQPHLPIPYNNRGVVLCQLGQYPAAIADFRQALALNPGYASAYCNLGLALYENGDADEAYTCLETAMQHAPHHAQARYYLSMLKLARGDYESGWPLYAARFQVLTDPQRPPESLLWRETGSLVGKSILILAEMTLSDTLQFCRYLPLIKAFKPNQIIIAVPEALFNVLNECWAQDASIQVIRQDGRPLPHFDVYCPMLSLPAVFKTLPDTVPANLPYLAVHARHSQPWQQLLGPTRRLRIGLNWCGDADNKYDKLRSIPLYLMAPLLQMEVEWHSLQKEFRREDHIMLKRFPMLECHHPALTDLTETAGLIMQMDVVISVDTAVAHLAAALGKKVWLLLPQQAHFRWLQQREDSPWYPGMRLFRQGAEEPWDSVIDRVHQAITDLLATRALDA